MPENPPATTVHDRKLSEVTALLQRGDAAAAQQRLDALLRDFPGSAPAHKLAATLLAGAGRTGQALAHMHRASELAPGSAQLRCELGCLLAHAGQLVQALACFEATVGLQPSLADGWYFLGITLARLHRDEQALPPLRRARQLAPDQLRTLDALAQVEFRAGFPADALPLWRELARLRPDHDDTLLKLGESLGRLGFNEEAREHFRSALARRPQSADMWMALAQSEEDNGDREAAAAAYHQALSLRPGWAFPLAGLLGLLRGKAPEARVQEAQELQAGPTLANPDRALIGYELGKVLDGRGAYRAAMASWDDANAARRRMIGDFDPAALQQRVERTLQMFDAELFQRVNVGSDDARPVFVVGMPRSGTTLTEQIIGSHARAHGCGELPDMGLIAGNLPTRKGEVMQWPHIVEDIDPASLQQGIGRYLEAVTRHAPTDALRLVDKAPMNFYMLGLIALMFPRARVVWCRRDPRDIAVSIYGENFSLGERFATTFDGIGHCINLQHRLMRHWQAVLPIPVLELDYERLVSDIEPQARRLVDFVGLDWDPACLQFHQSERGVQTPSRWQVRQPVHTRSVGRWRNYDFALEPLLALLDRDPDAR